MIPGIELLPLGFFEDEGGWSLEVRRESRLPERTVQTNVSFSRRGVVRGLHFHVYDPAEPDEHGVPWDDPRVRHLWSTQSPIFSERDRRAS